MRVDYSPRQSGKTTRAVEWVRADPQRVLITFSQREMQRLRETYEDIAGRIFDWDTYRRLHLNVQAKIEEVGIDNADLILQRQVRHPLKLLTISDEEN